MNSSSAPTNIFESGVKFFHDVNKNYFSSLENENKKQSNSKFLKLAPDIQVRLPDSMRKEDRPIHAFYQATSNSSRLSTAKQSYRFGQHMNIE